MKNDQVARIMIQRIDDGHLSDTNDQVAVEEPLEIQLRYSTPSGRLQKNIAVTMRTPGNDEELAAGFLFTEGIIQNKEAIHGIKRPLSDNNRVLVTLQENVQPVLMNVSRNFYTTSSCGICGKASIEAISTASIYGNEKEAIFISSSVLYRLQGILKGQQVIFQNTGGLHASALFDFQGNFVLLREDVGRHNALDKIIGASLMKGHLPLSNYLLFLSGRAGFELVQKATMAGIKIIAAVGAPSSLAVELAKDSGITLIGFLKNDRFNLYSGYQRIKL